MTRRLDTFLFEPLAPRATAVFRIAWAVTIPYFFRQLPDAAPRGASDTPWLQWIYEHVIFSDTYTAIIWGLCLMLAIGWRPRAVAWTLVVLLLPLQRLYLHATSRLLLLLALAAFAIVRSDAALAAGGRRRRDAGPAWPIRLIQWEVTLVYGVNALAKCTPGFLSGDVLRGMALALPRFRADLATGAFDVGPVAVPVEVLAPLVVLIEAGLAIGFWIPRLRWPTAALGLAFHAALTRIVQIGQLDLATLFLYASFLLPMCGRRPNFNGADLPPSDPCVPIEREPARTTRIFDADDTSRND